MKKKFAIFMNIAMLVLCVGAIAVGVYSAKQATLSATGSIGFNAHNCDVDVTATIVGHSKTEHGVPETTPQSLIKVEGDTTPQEGNVFQIRGKDAKLSFGDVMFSDLGPSGEPQNITIELTLTNKSSFDVLVDYIEPTTENNKIDVVCLNDLAHLSPAPADGATTTDHIQVVTYTLSLLPNEDGDYVNIDTAIDLNLNLKLSKMQTVTPDQAGRLFEYTAVNGEAISSTNTDVALTSVPTVEQWTAAGFDADTLIIPSTAVISDGATGNKYSVDVVGVGMGTTPVANIDKYRQIVVMDGISSTAGGVGISFTEKVNIKSVALPKSLTTIGSASFIGWNLTSLYLPEGVNTIRGIAVGLCPELKAVSLPSTLETCEVLYYDNFIGCPLLKIVKTNNNNNPIFNVPDSYTFEDGVLTINSTTINDPAWRSKGINPLILDVDWGNFNGTSIGDAFDFCTSLRDITIPESVTEIRRNAFLGCAFESVKCHFSVDGKFDLTDGVITILSSDIPDTQAWCTENLYLNPLITEINWGNFNNRYIGSGAFNDASLRDVEVRDCVEELGGGAFSSSCITITLPAGLKKIGYCALEDVFAFLNPRHVITEIKFEAPNIKWGKVENSVGGMPVSYDISVDNSKKNASTIFNNEQYEYYRDPANV